MEKVANGNIGLDGSGNDHAIEPLPVWARIMWTILLIGEVVGLPAYALFISA